VAWPDADGNLWPIAEPPSLLPEYAEAIRLFIENKG
jgi:hypothetical protein